MSDWTPDCGQQHSFSTQRHPAQMLTWTVRMEGGSFILRLSWMEAAQCYARTWVWISEPTCKKMIRCGDRNEPRISALGAGWWQWQQEALWDLTRGPCLWVMTHVLWASTCSHICVSACTRMRSVCSPCFAQTAPQDLVMAFRQERALKPLRMGRKL